EAASSFAPDASALLQLTRTSALAQAPLADPGARVREALRETALVRAGHELRVARGARHRGAELHGDARDGADLHLDLHAADLSALEGRALELAARHEGTVRLVLASRGPSRIASEPEATTEAGGSAVPLAAGGARRGSSSARAARPEAVPVVVVRAPRRHAEGERRDRSEDPSESHAHRGERRRAGGCPLVPALRRARCRR